MPDGDVLRRIKLIEKQSEVIIPVPLSLKELMDRKFEIPNSIIGSSLLNYQALLVVGGGPKTYKSFTTSAICCHLAAATPLFNVSRSIRDSEREFTFPIAESQRILYLEQEVGERDLQLRFRQMLEGMSNPEKNLCLEKIHVHSCDHNMQLDKPVGIRYMAKLIEQVQPTILAIDPLIEFHTGDENSARDMALVMHGLDELREKYHFATILNHHLNKPAKENGGRSGPDNLRGSSVIYGKGDSFLSLHKDRKTDGRVRIDFDIRRGKPIGSIWVNLDANLRMQFERWNEGR